MIIFPKGDTDTVSVRTPHFSWSEFECKCKKQHKNQIDLELVSKLEDLRSACGNVPIKINSAYRCSDHNKAVSGSKRSKHMDGIAVDIVVKGVDPVIVAIHVARLGFTGIGVYKSFTHVDVRSGPLVAWIGE